jgi:ribosomal protein L11 methyltransferase
MWLSVTLHADAAHAEALCDALLSSGALSVILEDADAGTEREQPQFGEPGSADPIPWPTSRVVALFDPSVSLPNLISLAAAEAGVLSLPTYSVEEVAEQNWVQLTQAQFDPIQIDERLWIVPSWHEAPDSSAINIALDPGMAFGTGSHPTTSLCLRWLSSYLVGGESVLDYGTGSGILAIAAAKLGASRVVGVDIDPAALTAAEENARRNGVAALFRHVADPIEMRFDMVVANILTNPLKVLAPLLCARIVGGGSLILSGILADQAAEIIEVYRPYVELEAAAERDGWVLLAGSKQ